jgi:hypothetical protein
MEHSYNDVIEEGGEIRETEGRKSITPIGDNKELIFMDNDDMNQEFGLFRDQQEDESAIYEIEFQIYDKSKNIVRSYIISSQLI